MVTLESIFRGMRSRAQCSSCTTSNYLHIADVHHALLRLLEQCVGHHSALDVFQVPRGVPPVVWLHERLEVLVDHGEAEITGCLDRIVNGQSP